MTCHREEVPNPGTRLLTRSVTCDVCGLQGRDGEVFAQIPTLRGVAPFAKVMGHINDWQGGTPEIGVNSWECDLCSNCAAELLVVLRDMAAAHGGLGPQITLPSSAPGQYSPLTWLEGYDDDEQLPEILGWQAWPL